MKQTKRGEYFIRHSQHFLPYLTFRKIVNLILNVIELKFKVSSPRSLPVYIKIEPTPLCQLKCPGCKQSSMYYKKQFRSSMQISLDDFKRIVEPLSHTLLGISLSNHGEPLLHKNIASLIEYAHSKHIAVSFPTNLSMKLDETSIEKLVKSGLDTLFVSLDGASEETYQEYRVGGNFSRVLQNVKALSEAKRRFGLKRPKIIWKFVVFNHNKHEVEVVRQKYRELGFDNYELAPDSRTDPKAKKAKKAYQASLLKKRKGCFWLWHTMIIQWDGRVYPCCRRGNQLFNIGNVIQENSKEVWYSEKYRVLRQGFSELDKMHPVCKKCMGYESVISTETKTIAIQELQKE
ncbi:hypothetical protein PN36_04360 [Candidatus Thiomargarita nelsonii]|uniref:Radical SAM core domain-containing protein n=1 Tax=Candidatus Thiomargarita nelsonii TaxID=1003181 RepID=A0A0A6RNY4_9GAMM|nr:hypothetical protein PN36_04360 [Candidatus Thiomargarita nelsonii]